uniref:Sushi domain-containing protein n=1 Tax=Ciona savignyi TaxID=51511 RepID=H2YV07_CIOSA
MSTLTCTAAGVWDHAVPACVAALSSEGTCSPFSLGVGISVTPSDCGATVPLHRGTSCMFECEPGYFMMGTDLTYCTGVSNLWTATMPQCKSYCLGLPSISGSSLSPMSCGALQVLDGTVCTRQCEMGCVTAAGSTTSTRTCAAGKWTGNDDACMMGCTLQNGTTDSSLVTSGSRLYVTSATCVTDVQPVGSSCMLSCPANYVLVDGTATLKCTSGGHWNGPVAKCIPSYKCPQVSSIGAASVV